jgi:hypothetical protein
MDKKPLIIWFLYGLAALLAIYFGIVFYGGDVFLLDWRVISQAHAEPFIFHQFSKGPFQFSLTGTQFLISEQYFGTDFYQNDVLSALFLLLIWLGISGVYAVSTYWKRFWFIAVSLLLVLFINSLQLDQLALPWAQTNGKWASILFVILCLGPGYFFHAFRPQTSFLARWLVLMALPLAYLLTGLWGNTSDILFLIGSSHIGIAILVCILLFLIAEEVIFLLLYLITQTRGGSNNHVHFLVLSFFYLGMLTTYYLKKASIIRYEITFFEPLILLFITLGVASWSIKFKQPFLNDFSEYKLDIRILFGMLCLVALGFLALAGSRGNDPIMGAMDYLIVYFHLAQGAMFVFYIILNFLTPLIQGLKVFKIVYEEQNFPYATARLGAFIAILGFFFQADKEAYDLLVSGKYNYLADSYREKGDKLLTEEYYRQSAIYGWDNHYANYRLGYLYQAKNDASQAAYHFLRASKRYPTPQAFVNAANMIAFEEGDRSTYSLLREGQVEFSNSEQIKNNLALSMYKQGNLREANQLLNTIEKNQEVLTNRWRIGEVEDQAVSQFREGKMALKANILAKSGIVEVPQADSSWFDQPNPIASAFLINLNWKIPKHSFQKATKAYLLKPFPGNMNESLMNALAWQYYLSGDVASAFSQYDQILDGLADSKKVSYLNQMGKLALEQDAPKLAAFFFEKAVDLSDAEAALNLAVANM